MKVSTLVLLLMIVGLLKLMLGLTFALLWERRRASSASKAPAARPPPSTPIAPRVIFVPRLDAGRQMVIDARGGHSFELAFHMDPGRQHMRSHDAFERAGFVS